MSFDQEVIEHGGADCRECPAYGHCEVDTEQCSGACREMLRTIGPEGSYDERQD